jgi:hypothetical protein
MRLGEKNKIKEAGERNGELNVEFGSSMFRTEYMEQS